MSKKTKFSMAELESTINRLKPFVMFNEKSDLLVEIFVMDKQTAIHYREQSESVRNWITKQTIDKMKDGPKYRFDLPQLCNIKRMAIRWVKKGNPLSEFREFYHKESDKSKERELIYAQRTRGTTKGIESNPKKENETEAT